MAGPSEAAGKNRHGSGSAKGSVVKPGFHERLRKAVLGRLDPRVGYWRGLLFAGATTNQKGFKDFRTVTVPAA